MNLSILRPHLLCLSSLWLLGSAITATYAQPSIDVALGAGVPSSTGTIAPGSDLWRVDIDSSAGAFPLAVCNDGTSAVIYVRRGDATNRDRWHLHMQGGGGCRDGQACADRWKHHNTNYGAHKMSSAWAPVAGITGSGILAPNPNNHFANWNQVYLFYCSSDGWSGRGTTSTSAQNLAGAVTAYSIDFRGADIVDAVIETLRQENGPVIYREYDKIDREMPNLDAATDVVLSGSSAGGGGVIRSADRVFSRLIEKNLACTDGECPLRVAAVPDAIYGPGREVFDYSSSQSCALQGHCSYQQLMDNAWFDVMVAFWHSDGEASCVDFHSSAPLGDVWLCADTEHVLENHLLSPFFVRMDTQDNLISGNLVADGPLFDGLPVTATDFGQIVWDQLQDLETLESRSEEPRGTGPLEPPGVFGAQCEHHVTISNRAYFEVEVPRESSGTLVNTNDLLWEWYRGIGSDREAIEPFFGPGRSGACSPFIFGSGFEIAGVLEWDSYGPMR